MDIRKISPAIVWHEKGLIKIKPANSENIYTTDYSDELYRIVSCSRWNVTKGYIVGFVNKKRIFLHHLILQQKDGYEVDHINRDKTNNCKSNLRYVTRTENLINRPKQRSNTSGYVGVCWDKERKKWVAHMRIDGKIKKLGRFQSKEEAAQAYLIASEEHYPGILYQEPNHGSFLMQ